MTAFWKMLACEDVVEDWSEGFAMKNDDLPLHFRLLLNPC
jgi:hypothetical protein